MTPKTKIHNLKILMEFFDDVRDGLKTFEVRKNDRDFKVGEILKLREWNSIKKEYTGRVTHVAISYILHGGQFGIEEGYCVMAIH